MASLLSRAGVFGWSDNCLMVARMTDSPLDERGLQAAADYALKAQERGDRFLKEIGVGQIIQAYFDGLPPKIKDAYLENMVNRCNEELQANRPVVAWTWLRDIKKRLIEKDVI